MADDLLQGLKDRVGDNLGGDDENPQATIDKFLKALENMPGVSKEDKENLAKSFLEGGLMGGAPGAAKLTGGNLWMEFIILFGLITLITLVLGYIGYSLYHNIEQREKKREQKRLQKELKKKK